MDGGKKNIYQTLSFEIWMEERKTYTKHCHGSFPFYVDLFLFSIPDKTFTELDYISNTTSALLEAGTAYYSLAPELTPVFW
jgi:hypothetical protein